MQNQAASAVINILINTSTMSAGAAQYNRVMQGMAQSATKAAQESALSWNSIFGANFFSDLASSMVLAMGAGFRQVVSDAVKAAITVENAWAGLGGTAKNLGLSQQDVIETVKNMDLVKNGLLQINDAAVATKNLLATGFSLPQAIDLIKRFGDTAAFGRQASLSFGYAIASATEGIKNQNSILVDNAGVTKNLSIILKERGFQIQDLSDKVKGAAAREALYQGLIKETSIQLGDANKLLDTAQGRYAQLEAAQFRASASLGEFFTKSTLAKTALSGFVTVLDVVAKSPGAVLAAAAAVGTLTAAIIAMNTAQIASLPVIGQLISSIALMGRVMVRTAGLIQGATATIAVATAGWAALVVAIGAVIYALIKYNTTQSKTIQLTQEAIQQTAHQKESYVAQEAALSSLNNANLTAIDRHQILEQAYRGVNVQSQERVAQATTEAEKISILADEYKRLADQEDRRIETNSRIAATNLFEQISQYEKLTEQQIQAASRADDLRRQFNESVEFARRTSGAGGASVAPELEQDARRADAAFAEFGQQLVSTSAQAKDAYAQLELLAKIRGTDIETIIQQKFAYEGNAQAADAAIQKLHQMQVQMGLLGKQTVSTTDALQEQITVINQLSATSSAADRRSAVKDVLETIANQTAGDPSKAVGRLNELRQQNKALDDQIKFLQGFDKATKELNEQLSPKDETRRKSPAVRLADGLKNLRFEVESFKNATSKSFQLRFEREELERTKRDFEQILDLRRELALPLDLKLPGTAEEARREVEHLQRIKNLRDDVLKIYHETEEAEDRLAVARITATADVVSAQVRADTAYLEGVRKRRDAEEQLTADIAANLRRRNEFEVQAVRERTEAEAEAFRDLLEERNRETSDRLRQIARIQALSGSTFGGNPLVDAARGIAGRTPADSSPVLQRLDKSNDLLTQILDAVKGSGLSGADVAASVPRGERTERGLRQFITGRGFQVNRTFGRAINPGSLHPLGLAADIDIHGKSRAEQENLIFDLIAAGYRVVDERRKIPGVKQTGPHIHAEINNRRTDNIIQTSLLTPAGRARLSGGTSRATFPNSTPRVPTGAAGADSGAGVTFPSRIQSAASNLQGFLANGPTDNGRAGEISQQFFGTRNLNGLGPEALNALERYIEAQRDFTRNTAEQTIGVDRLNQSLSVNFTNVRQLEVAQARLDRLRSGDAIDVQEAKQEAEIQQRQEAARVLQDLIGKEEYLAKLRAGDAETLRRLEEARRGTRTNEIVGLERELADLRDESKRGGRDPEVERLRTEKERLQTIVQAGHAIADLEQQRKLFADDAYRDAVRMNDITREQTSLERQLFDIENERATGSYNQALRVRIAAEDELLQIQRENLKAQEDIARAVVRIEDAEKVHYDQANARVLDHISKVKSMTDIYADFKIGIVDTVYGGIDRLTDKLASKLPVIGGLFGDLINGVLKLSLNKVFMRLLFPDLNITSAGAPGTAASGASGGGFSGGFGGGFGGFGTPPFVGNFSGGGGVSNVGALPPGLVQMLTGINIAQTSGVPASGATGGGPHIPANFGLPDDFFINGTDTTVRPRTVTQEIAQRQSIAGALADALRGGGATGTRPRIARVPGKVFGTGGIFGRGGIFGDAGFGFNSGTISTLGAFAGIAGSLIGGPIGGGLMGAATGIGLASSLSSILGISAIGGPIGLAIGAIVGGAIGVFGSIFHRNKVRRREETQRAAFLTDAKRQLQQIIDQLRGGQMDSVSALAAAQQIRDAYIQQSNQLTDRKTRTHALQTVRELDAMIEQIKVEGRRADFAIAQEDAFVPTFAVGGNVSFATRTMATQRRTADDNVLGLFNVRETVVTPSQYFSLGGHEAFRRAGVRGAGLGSFSNDVYDSYRPTAGTSTWGGTPNIEVVAFADEDSADAWVNNARPKTTAKKVKVAIRYGQDDGLLKTVEKGLAGDF